MVPNNSAPVAFSKESAQIIEIWVGWGSRPTRILFKQGEDYFHGETAETDRQKIRDCDPSKWDSPPAWLDLSRTLPAFDASSMTLCPDAQASDVYTKRLNLFPDREVYTELFGSTRAPLTLREIRTCEFLRQHPHRNLCAYRGVVVHRGLVHGLCFEKYSMDLHQAVKRGLSFNAESALSQIERAIEHLHSLGKVHADVKPDNVFVNAALDHFVLGDFDSCHENGASLRMKHGTALWSPTDKSKAEPRLDWFGLSMIRKWVEKKGFGNPVPGLKYGDTKSILAKAVDGEDSDDGDGD